MSRSSDSIMSIPCRSCCSDIWMVGNVRQWHIQGILYIFPESECEEAQFVPFRHPKVRVMKFHTAWLLTYGMLIQVIVKGIIPWSFSLDFCWLWASKERGVSNSTQFMLETNKRLAGYFLEWLLKPHMESYQFKISKAFHPGTQVWCITARCMHAAGSPSWKHGSSLTS